VEPHVGRHEFQISLDIWDNTARKAGDQCGGRGMILL
jgi:hypothetical protein